MSEQSCFRRCFEKQYGKRAKTLLKFTSQHLYHIYWSLARKLCLKKSLLLISKVFGLLLNRLATDEQYSVPNRVNLTIPIQMQLSQKPKIFLSFLLHF